MKKMLIFSLLLLALALTAACGDDNKGAEFNGVTPSSGVTVETGKQVFLNALAKNTEISWNCPEGAACTPVGKLGLDFVAPAVPGTYTVEAFGNGVTKTATITVIWAAPEIAISADPPGGVTAGTDEIVTITVSFTHPGDMPPGLFPTSAYFTLYNGDALVGNFSQSGLIATLTPAAEIAATGNVTVKAEAMFQGKKLTATTREIKITKPSGGGGGGGGDCGDGTEYTVITPDATLTVNGEPIVITATGIKDTYTFGNFGFGDNYAFWFEEGGTISFNQDITLMNFGTGASKDFTAGEAVEVDADLNEFAFFFDGFGAYLTLIYEPAPGANYGALLPDQPWSAFPGTVEVH